MRTVMDMYSYNDHIQRCLDKRIKDELDPKGILSPGHPGTQALAVKYHGNPPAVLADWPARLKEPDASER
jgi:hypothetical protein